MANLNLNEIFWIEIAAVTAKMGSEDAAVGNALRWFRYSQEKHKNGKLVSEDEFKDMGFHESLFPRFAKRLAGGIQCVGAGKHFTWLKTKSESGSEGGQASARARRAKGSAVPIGATNRSNIEPAPKQTEADPKQLEAPEPIVYGIHNSIPKDSDLDERDTRARPPATSAFGTWEAMRDAIPIDTATRFAKWYPDPKWRDEQYEKCFVKAMEDPLSAPKSKSAWMQRLHSWLEIGWKMRPAIKQVKQSLADLELPGGAA